MNDRRRYLNILRKMNLQEEDVINETLRKKGFYSESDVYPLSSLHFELTSHCNAFCRHCYNNSGENKYTDAMTPEKWIAFSRYIVKHGGVFECLLSGGEPLLIGDNLFKIMDILHDDGTIFFVMTNGYLLTNEMVKKFKSYKYHWFQISIDGAKAEYHDYFRQTQGSWEKAVKAAHVISDNEIPLKIAHCVTPDNLNDIDEICSLAYSLGASSIMIGGISLSGRTGLNKELLLSKREKEILKYKIEENCVKYKDKMKVKSANSVKQGLEKHSKQPRSGVLIRPNGDIRIDGMAPFIIGNILRDDFTDIWNKKIDQCWFDSRVQNFISGFDEEDHNNDIINYLESDILL